VLVTGANTTSRAASNDYATVAYSATTGAQRWISLYNGPASTFDGATALAVAPDGTRVYVTGISKGKISGSDCATVAYRTATGAQVWVKRYNGTGNGKDGCSSIATSPDGTKVFVTGFSAGTTPHRDYITLGYNAATGTWLWGSRYNGPGNLVDQATTVVTSASRVVVTGVSFLVLGNPGTSDYVTIAYAP
jgi:hypothetical protein